MAITAAAVNELRQATGCGLMDCKKALVETEGDMEKAIVYLREKGLAGAEKKSSRVAAEGMAYADSFNGVGSIVEINCESDFVAGNDLFVNFVKGVAQVVAEQKPATVDDLANCKWISGEGTVADAKNELFLSVRENMQLRRFAFVDNGLNVAYVHMKGKVAVLVTLDTESTDEKVVELGKDLAMQIAAMNPQFLSKEDVDPAFIAKEKEIRLAQAKQDPANAKKPDAIIEKIVDGGINKYYKEICLLQQGFVKGTGEDVSAHIADVAKAVGSSISIKGYVRYEKGEGIEKKEDDLAAEVAKMIG